MRPLSGGDLEPLALRAPRTGRSGIHAVTSWLVSNGAMRRSLCLWGGKAGGTASFKVNAAALCGVVSSRNTGVIRARAPVHALTHQLVSAKPGSLRNSESCR